ncbi:MAG: hypothetical protein CIT02_01600 [Methanobacterium sp. BAmetb5]|nr:MAG: hypothetical protein CIT02_01600 [Methanobacterium sp. BAmetb5]
MKSGGFSMENKSYKSGFVPENIIYTPNKIISFISNIVAGWEPERVLDPACGSGTLFPKINEHSTTKTSFIGVDISKEIIEKARKKLKDTDVNYELFNTDFFTFKDSVSEKFDLIVTQPSFVQLQESVDFYGFKILDLEIHFLMESLKLLKKNGHAVFILPEQKSFFNSDYYNPLRQYILDNYSLEAIISLPYNTLYPYSSTKTCILIIKNDTPRDKVFFAKFHQNVEDIIINNYFEETFNDNFAQGIWIDSSTLNGDKVYWTFDFMRGLEEFKKKTENSPYSLKFLTDLTKFRDKFAPERNVFLFPKVPHNDVIFLTELENKDEISDYYQFILSDKNISEPYLKIYLNSEAVKNELILLSYGNTQKKLDMKGIKSLQIEVPDLKTQNNIVDSYQRAELIFNEIGSAFRNFKRNIFNYHDLDDILSKFDDEYLLYQYQIWPFATSHHMASKTDTGLHKRLDNYFKLFEMIAAFNTILLLSALPPEICYEGKKKFWDTGSLKYYAMSFGSWVGLYERLISFYDDLKDEVYELIPFERSFYKNIANPQIIDILTPIVNLRNQKAHGGAMPDVFIKKQILELNEKLNELFQLLGDYESMDLIYTTGMEKNRGLYTIRAKLLKGNVYPFAEYKFHTETDMDSKVLYLYNPVSDDRLKLIPELIKMVECSDCGSWSLYFYNSLKDKYARYVSYQYEIHDYEDTEKEVEGFFKKLNNDY